MREGTRWAAGAVKNVIIIRLAPAEDLKITLEEIIQQEKLTNLLILGGAASLRCATLRNVKTFPKTWPINDANRLWTKITGPLELVSITGNVSHRPNGRPFLHAHVVVSKSDGLAYGGHLVEGSEILTTGELVFGELSGVKLRRDRDPGTLGDELFPDPA